MDKWPCRRVLRLQAARNEALDGTLSRSYAVVFGGCCPDVGGPSASKAGCRGQVRAPVSAKAKAIGRVWSDGRRWLMNGFEVRERRLLCIAEGLGSTTPKEGKEL